MQSLARWAQATHRRRRLWLLAAACVAGGAPVPTAAAQGAGLRLDWVRGHGATECLDHAALATRVVERLGRDPFQPPYVASVEGLVIREGDAFVGTLSLLASHGESLGARTFRADRSCAELTDAIELALALVVDELVPAEAPRATTAEEHPDPPAPDVSPENARPETARAETAETPHTRVRGWLALTSPFSFGALPGPAAGLGLAGGVRLDAWQLDVFLQAFPEHVLVDGDARLAFSWIAFGAAVGLAAEPFEWLSVAGALGVELGVVAVSVSGVSALDAAPAPTVAPFGALTVRVPVFDLLALELGGRVAVPLLPRQYLAAGTERAIHTQAPVGVTLWLALVLRFDGPGRFP